MKKFSKELFGCLFQAGGGAAAAAAGGAPSRKLNRPKSRLAPSELPEEETKRIAKIFSSKFSKKE